MKIANHEVIDTTVTNEEVITPMIEAKKRFFSPLEIIAIGITILLVVVLLLTSISTVGKDFVESNLDDYIHAGIVTEIYNKPVSETGRAERQTPFGAVSGSYQLLMEPNSSEEEVKSVNNLFQFVVPKIHALSDRHNYYSEATIYPDGYFVEPLIATEIPFAAKVVSNDLANSPEVKSSPRINNLRVINESLNMGPVEVPYDLYHLLQVSVDLTIKTNSAFNLFIGELSLWWNEQIDSNKTPYPLESEPLANETNRAHLNKLQSYIPLTSEEINETLKFIEKDNKYYVDFSSAKANVGELSITLGGIAKGYANEVLVNCLTKAELNRGLFFGAGSSIDVLSHYFNANEGWNITVTSNSVASKENGYNTEAFGISFNNAPFSLSTSGGDQIGQNYYFTTVEGVTYHRHHIIDARTGEPANYKIVDVNIISSVLTSYELDAITTALMCMSVEAGEELVKQINEAKAAEVGQGDVALRACWLTREKYGAPFKAFATNEYFDYVVPLNNIKISKI